MLRVKAFIEDVIKSCFGEKANILKEGDIVGQDIYDEYLNRADQHIKKIHKSLADAGYSYSPILSADIDEYGIVRFEVSIIWDKLSEVQNRIREGLPDRTMQQRWDAESSGKE
jgi:hypothetical protein